MPINLTNPTVFNTAALVGDSLSGGYPPTLTQVGGLPIAAALEVQSTLGAFVLPRMTDPLMEALFPVVDGMLVYNTTNTAVYAHQGGNWSPVGAGGGGTITSLTQGANIVLTPSPITTTGSVALNPVLTGLTSAVIGNLSISTSANTISSSAVLNITSSGNMVLTPTASLLQLNADTQVRSGLALQLFNAANSFRASFTATGLLANVDYILPTSAPSINGQMLTSTTTGTMSWVTPGTGTVTSITAGSNLTGGTITGTGTIALSNAVSGLTSLSVGTLTMSGSTVAGSGSLTIQSLAAMDLSPSQLRLNSEVQVRSANTLRLMNSGNTFSTSLTAGALLANINYTLPITAPTNGQVLSSTSGGVMSWITAGSGSVTSISQGANIVCTPNPIVGTGTVALNPVLTGVTSAVIGNISISGNTIIDSTTNLTIDSVGLIALGGTGVASANTISIGANKGIQLFNGSNTFSTSIIPGNVAVNTSYTLPSAYPAVNGYVLSSDTIGTMSWVAQSGGGVTTAKYLLQQANAGLPNAQSMGALATGIVKNTTTTGVQSIAAAGTDYYAPGSPTTIIENNNLANLFLGNTAGNVIASGASNTGIGHGALPNVTSGNANTCLGAFAGTSITSTGSNVMVGDFISPNSAPDSCTYIGSNVAASMTGANQDNTWVGTFSGSGTTSSTRVTLLGSRTAVGSALTNSAAIGYGTTISVSNAINLGNGCNVGINTASPAYALHVSPISSNAHFFLGNSTTAPSASGSGGILYISSGALVYVGSNGTATIIAPA